MASCRLLLVLLVFAQCFSGETLTASPAESSTRPHASTHSPSPRTHPAGSAPPPTLQPAQATGNGTERAMFTAGLSATAPPASSTEPPLTSQVATSTGHGAVTAGQRTASISQGAATTGQVAVSTSQGAESASHGSMPTAGPADKEGPLTQKPGLIAIICIFLIILFIGAVVILVKCCRTRDPGFQKLDEVPMGNVTEGSPIAHYPRK